MPLNTDFVKKTGWVLLLLMTLGGLFYQFISTPDLFLYSQKEALPTQSFFRSIESSNPFQIGIIEKDKSLSDVKKLQILLTTDRVVENLYLNLALVQDINIIEEGSDELPDLLPSLAPQVQPLTYDLTIRITGDRPHLILEAYVLGSNGEKVGEYAEFYVVSEQNLLSRPSSQIQIDPSKVKVIR